MMESINIINILSGKQNRTALVKANNRKMLFNTFKCYSIEGYKGQCVIAEQVK